jgi:hypothetical protein
MNKKLGVAAFCVGLAAVCWVGLGYIRSNPLALTMTALIGAFYLMGALELRRFHQATTTLAKALTAIPENLSNLADWLDKVPPALRNAVRQRIEGERAGLPGPVMTPYLVGLLVLLGMLGTFLGMVVTLDGAVLALESTTDLPTIRAALSAPVKGLGLAFGTSVAGVAASAMLGLISAVCRRERLQTLQVLDTRIATNLHTFSLAHLRKETFKTLQSQSLVIPEVVAQLQAMMAHSERQSQALNDRLLASQEAFFRNTTTVYADLASSVDKSLKESLATVARVAGAAIEPVAQATMAGIARETTALHERIAGTVGYPLPDVQVRVADEHGVPLGPGEVGVVEVIGPNVFAGYWGMPDKTAASFRDDGYFITGDLGSLSTDGRLTLSGRGTDLIISGGLNVYPKEIEMVLDEIDGVEESAVVGVVHPDLGDAVVAILVADASFDVAAVTAALDGRLARFKHPKHVAIVSELPRNAMGKVEKAALRQTYGALFS